MSDDQAEGDEPELHLEVEDLGPMLDKLVELLKARAPRNASPRVLWAFDRPHVAACERAARIVSRGIAEPPP